MTRQIGKAVASWLARWGFAVLVASALVCAAGIASTVDPPAEVPSFALRAGPVYRLEVGTAVFAGLYLAVMALVLALNNKAFSEIGTSGMKAQDIGGPARLEAIREQQRELLALARITSKFRGKTERDATATDTIDPDDN